MDGLPEPRKLVSPKAENEGREFVQGLPIKSEEGMEGYPVLLADSVSLDEQKAKGDVKKKGRLDPYAYIPLNRTKLNHRKKMKLQGQFKGLVKAAQRGSQVGHKLRRKDRRP